MMTYGEFVNRFTPVLDAFEARRFPTIVLQRIHSKVMDLSPVEMTELCNLVIDNCEHAPKTAKVSEFANVARARCRQGVRDPKAEVLVDCGLCHDLRAVRALATDATHETLMLCECTIRKPNKGDWKLPAWSRAWLPLYRREACPISWFKPETIFMGFDGSIKFEQSIDKCRAYWAAKVKIAEQFWKHQRKEAMNEAR